MAMQTQVVYFSHLNFCIISVSSFSFLRGATLSAENSDSLTPVLTAVDHKQMEAFHYLTEYTDMTSVTENPAFKVLSIRNYEILEVRPSFDGALCS